MAGEKPVVRTTWRPAARIRSMASAAPGSGATPFSATERAYACSNAWFARAARSSSPRVSTRKTAIFDWPMVSSA